MNPPAIEYATTSDGVRIAFAVSGSGPVLLYLASVGGVGLRNESESPWRDWTQALNERFTLVRYDMRGAGMSQRDLPRVRWRDLLTDAEAVVAKLGLPSFNLFAFASAYLAPLYAREHPHQVERLILWPSSTGDSSTRENQALMPLLQGDWYTFTETFARLGLGWDNESAVGFAKAIRENTDPRTFGRLMSEMLGLEADEYLEWASGVRAETLVLQRSLAEDEQKVLRWVAAFPKARLQLLGDLPGFASPRGNGAPFRGSPSDLRQVVDAMAEFVSPGSGQAPVSLRATTPQGTVTILFIDIVDSTSLTERLGDSEFRSRSRQLDAALRALVREHGGTPVEGKVLGDGVMATFASASRAIEAALACNAAASQTELRLHLGLHAGDVILEADNVYGGAVNLAARVCGLSAPGEVLVSETVRALARTSAGVRFEDRGLHELKGIEEPQRLYAVLPAL